MDRDEVSTRLRAALDSRAEILEAYLFGSVACGRAKAHSDVDVAVYVDPERVDLHALDYQAELTAELMSALGTNGLDLVVLNAAPPLLYHRVLRDADRLLSRDLVATTRRESAALSRYFDYLPQLRKIGQAHARRVASGRFGR